MTISEPRTPCTFLPSRERHSAGRSRISPRVNGSSIELELDVHARSGVTDPAAGALLETGGEGARLGHGCSALEREVGYRGAGEGQGARLFCPPTPSLGLRVAFLHFLFRVVSVLFFLSYLM